MEREMKKVKYIWMVKNSGNPCDIRRYAYTHEEAIQQLNHPSGRKSPNWSLYKLVKINKRQTDKKRFY